MSLPKTVLTSCGSRCPICSKQVDFLDVHLVEKHCFSHSQAKLFHDGSLVNTNISRKPLIKCSLCDSKVLSIRHHIKSQHMLHEKSEEFMECIAKSCRNKEYLKGRWFTADQDDQRESKEVCRAAIADLEDSNSDSIICLGVGKQADISDKELRYSQHCTMLLGSIQDCFNSQTFADILVRCGTVTIPCHRVVLSSASPLMRMLLKDGTIDVIIVPETDKQTLRAFILFIYNGRIELPNILLGEFLQLANVFDIASIVNFDKASADGSTVSKGATIRTTKEISRMNLGATMLGIDHVPPANLPTLPAQSEAVVKKEIDPNCESGEDFALINVGFEDYQTPGLEATTEDCNHTTIRTRNTEELSSAFCASYSRTPAVLKRDRYVKISGNITSVEELPSHNLDVNASNESNVLYRAPDNCVNVQVSPEKERERPYHPYCSPISASIASDCGESISLSGMSSEDIDRVGRTVDAVTDMTGPASAVGQFDRQQADFVPNQTRPTEGNVAAGLPMVMFPSNSLSLVLDGEPNSPLDTTLTAQGSAERLEEPVSCHAASVDSGQTSVRSFKGDAGNISSVLGGADPERIRNTCGNSPRPCSVLLERLTPFVIRSSSVNSDLGKKVCNESGNVDSREELLLNTQANTMNERKRKLNGSEAIDGASELTGIQTGVSKARRLDTTFECLGGFLETLKDKLRDRRTLENMNLYRSSSLSSHLNSRLVVYGVRIGKPQLKVSLKTEDSNEVTHLDKQGNSVSCSVEKIQNINPTNCMNTCDPLKSLKFKECRSLN